MPDNDQTTKPVVDKPVSKVTAEPVPKVKVTIIKPHNPISGGCYHYDENGDLVPDEVK